MKWMRRFRGCVVALAAVGILLPQMSFAAAPAAGAHAPALTIRDVALDRQGSLRGQVVDVDGQQIADAKVAAVQQGKIVAQGKTDAAGRYEIAGLKSGVYQVVTDDGITVCRVWSAGTAPPAAQSDALIVNGDPVIRARLGRGGGVIGFLSNPWVLGALVAAAIAIPLALDDDDDGS